MVTSQSQTKLDTHIALRWIALVPSIVCILLVGPWLIRNYMKLDFSPAGPTFWQFLYLSVCSACLPPVIAILSAYYLAPTVKLRITKWVSAVVMFLVFVNVGDYYNRNEYMACLIELGALAACGFLLMYLCNYKPPNDNPVQT